MKTNDVFKIAMVTMNDKARFYTPVHNGEIEEYLTNKIKASNSPRAKSLLTQLLAKILKRDADGAVAIAKQLNEPPMKKTVGIIKKPKPYNFGAPPIAGHDEPS